jgi:hypothetical protein
MPRSISEVPGIGPSAPVRDEGLVPPPRRLWCPPVSDRLLVILFGIFLLSPVAAYWLNWPTSIALNENRNLARAPSFAYDPVATWPGRLDAYYNDRFGFRAPLIRFYSLLLHKYLGASNDDVVIGKDGWIFYAREDIFQDFFGQRLFSEGELKRWKDYLENRRTMLLRNNSHYLFVIAPDKNTVYPEKLPDYVRQHRGRSRVQQLMAYLKQTGSPAEILDLHDAMMQAKGQGNLFFPQDTHWNGRGYFVAYQAMCAALNRWYPEIRPQKLGVDYALRTVPWAQGEWTLFGLTEENLGYRSEFLVPLGTQRGRKGVAPFPAEIAPLPERWSTPLYWEGPGQHALLVFNDSYMRTGPLDKEQVPLAEHFARTLLDKRRPSDHEVQLIVDDFHPDVVIEERAERLMRAVPDR